MRAAIYYTPPRADPLTRCAADWLGRDAFTELRTRQPDAVIDLFVTDAARYGFHATIKAPFRLAPGRALEELAARLSTFSRNREGLDLGRLDVARLDGFFALVPTRHQPNLAALEADVRVGFDEFRASLTEVEIRRRQPDRLTERQRQNLLRWGYPHVGADFWFHMTLASAPAADPEARAMEEQLRAAFDPVLRRPAAIDALALFVEPAPGEPFHVHSLHALRAPIPIGVFAP